MNVKAIEMKCPVCGMVNAPREIKTGQGYKTFVLAKYECQNSKKRLFRRDKPCGTRYSVEWNGDKAARVIERMKEG